VQEYGNGAPKLRGEDLKAADDFEERAVRPPYIFAFLGEIEPEREGWAEGLVPGSRGLAAQAFVPATGKVSNDDGVERLGRAA
jgi:hypothetical protein